MQTEKRYRERNISELALEHAAKIICELKYGLCPLREENFSSCPYTCSEDIRPWQCWVAHLREVSANRI
jgi:hypothetical protein